MAPASSRRAPAISTAAPAFSSRPGPGGAAAAYACGERGWSGDKAGTPPRDPRLDLTRPVLSRPGPLHRDLSRPHPFPTVPNQPVPSRLAGSRSIPTHAHRLCPDPTLSRPVPAGSTHGRQAQLHIVGPHSGDRHLLGALCHDCRGRETCPGSAPGPAPAPAPGPHRPGPPRSRPRPRPAGRAAPPSPGHNEPLELPGSRGSSLRLCPPAPSPSSPSDPWVSSPASPPSRGGRGCRGHAPPHTVAEKRGAPSDRRPS